MDYLYLYKQNVKVGIQVLCKWLSVKSGKYLLSSHKILLPPLSSPLNQSKVPACPCLLCWCWGELREWERGNDGLAGSWSSVRAAADNIPDQSLVTNKHAAGNCQETYPRQVKLPQTISESCIKTPSLLGSKIGRIWCLSNHVPALDQTHNISIKLHTLILLRYLCLYENPGSRLFFYLKMID